MRLIVLLILNLGFCVGCTPRPDPAVTGPNNFAQPIYSAPAYTPPPAVDYNAKSLLLKPGMTEVQVTAALGTPTKAELTTCGQQTPKAWQCKIWTYGSLYKGIRVYFTETGPWVVNNWDVM